MEYVALALVFFSVLFGICGVWLMMRERGSVQDRINSRMLGVKQVRRYELGDALAASRDREAKRKAQRKEALKHQAYSDIPAVDKVLKKTTWADKLNGMLLQAQMPISVANFTILSGILLVMGVAVSILWRRQLDPILAAIMGLPMGVAPFMFVLLKVKRRIRKFATQLPDALDLLSSSVKAGQSLNAAIQNVAEEMPEPVCDEFKIISDEMSFGVSLELALKHLVVRMNTPDVRFLTTALIIQKETGGNLSEVLDGLQKTIRERFRILGQVKTLTAQGKLSGLIVGVLPLALCAFMYFANPNYMRPIFSSTMGQWLVGIALGLQITGVAIITKIVNIKV